ncbi:hypothetical protein DNK59_05520 [Pseudomonas sp. TKO26]|uniref:hypothetical protein n=1 Tax=unclassified Pseudomonas TaxID=196821 RepID=UPI000D8BFB12|nr:MULTISPECIES: hypothetical protein [unclassified Pseudomonas]PYY89553.1 hypothetical protein DNK62_05520 [Pseudomonas sp. TKO30]PYY92640.1 hypothetical protein DNK61_05520 [Pseudomonas sp. TKO29]PYY95004.1 hypothetical protein DNK59_05520 [Pseudomonas sp. TKO26]PYZ01090.1 hypothetical protein DNK60_05520 [Pseudomonas sp. TKO14]
MAWFKKKTPPAAAADETASAAADPSSGEQATEPRAAPREAASNGTDPAPEAAPSPPSAAAQPSVMETMNAQLLKQAGSPSTDSTDALNSQIVQAVQFTNAQTFSYAPAQIAIAPDMMISQAAGLVAQSAAGYFDGVSKLALAAQAVLLKQMTENIVKENVKGAAEDALGVLATDLMVGAAAAVAAAAGAMEADAAGMAIDKIDASIAKYSATLANRPSSS